MKYRKFGRTGWMLSEIGYGMWGMGEWSGSNDIESLESLQLSVDLGCNFFDTAWGYGEGHSEYLLGELIRANPEKKLFTATKIPPKNMKWPSQRHYTLNDCYPPNHIEEFVKKSLINSGLEYFDLMQFHVWEDSWVKDKRWVASMVKLRSRGYFNSIGISINRWEPWNGVEAVESGFIDAVQVIYNIFDQNPEDQLFPACKRMNVGVIARVPFDEGTLTGNLSLDSKWPDGDWRNTYFVPENLIPSVARAEEIKAMIRDEMTMPELALRFILNNDAVTTIIPGMRKKKHVINNMSASDLGPLPGDLHKLLRKFRWERQPTTWSQ